MNQANHTIERNIENLLKEIMIPPSTTTKTFTENENAFCNPGGCSGKCSGGY